MSDLINKEIPKEPQVDTNLSQSKVDTNLAQQTQQNQLQQEKEPESLADPNWKAFREARKKEREEKEAAERKAAEKEREVTALKAAMEAAFSKSAPTPQAYQQYYGMNNQPEESEDERIEKKFNALIEQRERHFLQQQEERERHEYPARLKKDYPDFNNVCSQDNLDYLDYHYPELSRPLQRLQEGYDKWSDIYHAVKKLIPNHSNAKREAQKAEINQNKPRSISSQGLTPNGDKSRETWQEIEQRRAANYERMQRTMKGVVN